MEVVIDFNIEESPQSLYALLRRLAPLLELRGRSPKHEFSLTLNLSKCKYFGPIGVAVMGLLVRDLTQGGWAVRVIAPTHRQLLAYTEFSGFAKLCWGGAIADPAHPKSETLPLVFTGRRDDSAILRIVTLISRRSKTNQDMISHLQTLLGELLVNIEDHAGAEGLITARWISKDKTIRIVVADFGVGLQRSLSRRFDVGTHRRAIELALTERTTSKLQTRNFGNGLPTVRDRLKFNGGDLILASGDAIFALSSRAGPAWFPARPPNILLPGTLCALKFRIDPDLYEADDDDTEAVLW